MGAASARAGRGTTRVDERIRPPWRDVATSLDRYDRGALHHAVREWIDEFLPRNVPRRKGRAELRDLAVYQRRLDLVVSRAAGVWYGCRGWRVGNESFGGCFCHSFLSEYTAAPRGEGVLRATEWVVAEVDVMVRCLRDFDLAYRLFGMPADPGDRAAALAAAVDRVFEAVASATACNAAWHRYVVDGVAWLLDHHAIEAPPVLGALIDASVSASCADFIPAPARERYRLCDDLAAVFVTASDV